MLTILGFITAYTLLSCLVVIEMFRSGKEAKTVSRPTKAPLSTNEIRERLGYPVVQLKSPPLIEPNQPAASVVAEILLDSL